MKSNEGILPPRGFTLDCPGDLKYFHHTMRLDVRHIIFDWGDTLMRDDLSRTESMYLWPEVHAVEGAESTLRALANDVVLSVATNAAGSDAAMVRKALERGHLDSYITHVFTRSELGCEKTDVAFWSKIQSELQVRPEEILVVGDSFEGDVMTSTAAGFRAMWFNPGSREKRSGDRYSTIHQLEELVEC